MPFSWAMTAKLEKNPFFWDPFYTHRRLRNCCKDRENHPSVGVLVGFPAKNLPYPAGIGYLISDRKDQWLVAVGTILRSICRDLCDGCRSPCGKPVPLRV